MTGLLHPNAAPFRLDGEGQDEIVFIHGWTGSPAHLRPISRVLCDAGYHVSAPLLAGHGTTESDMANTTWRDWVRSAGEAAEDVLERGHRLHLAGLSMGGAICLLIAPVFGAASVTTINAPIKVFDWKVKLSPLVRGSAKIRKLPPDVVPTGEMAEFAQHYDDQPVGTIAELLDLVRAVRRNLATVKSPTLVVQSLADETVKPVSANIIFDGLGSVEKRILWLPRSQHVATTGDERHLIADAMVDHIGGFMADLRPNRND